MKVTVKWWFAQHPYMKLCHPWNTDQFWFDSAVVLYVVDTTASDTTADVSVGTNLDKSRCWFDTWGPVSLMSLSKSILFDWLWEVSLIVIMQGSTKLPPESKWENKNNCSILAVVERLWCAPACSCVVCESRLLNTPVKKLLFKQNKTCTNYSSRVLLCILLASYHTGFVLFNNKTETVCISLLVVGLSSWARRNKFHLKRLSVVGSKNLWQVVKAARTWLSKGLRKPAVSTILWTSPRRETWIMHTNPPPEIAPGSSVKTLNVPRYLFSYVPPPHRVVEVVVRISEMYGWLCQQNVFGCWVHNF